MNDGNEKEVWERLTACESSVKSAHHRLDSIEQLTQSVSDMVVEVRHMREDLNNVRAEIDEVKSRPIKFYDKLMWAIVGATASGIVSIVLSQIFQ
jgi:hypothetical protein